MARIYDDITRTIGNTPLVKVKKLIHSKAIVLAKMESHNPLGSVKDRIGMAMIEAAERAARSSRTPSSSSRPAATPASRWRSSARRNGYKLILTMPETMSSNAARCSRLGAEARAHPRRRGHEGRDRQGRGAARTEPRTSLIPQQFNNPANPEIHRRTTAEEIWDDTDGKVDYPRRRRRHGRHDHRRRRSHQARKPVVPGHRGRRPKFPGHFAGARRSRSSPARTRSRASARALCRRS